MTAEPISRRRFLAGALAVLAATAVACTDDGAGHKTTSGKGGSDGDNQTDRDLEVAALVAGIEVLAVDTYRATIEAATAGKLGEVPSIVRDLLAAAKAHHGAHLEAWNKRLAAGHQPAVRLPNGGLKPAIDAALGNASTAHDALAMSRRLEETAAATYLSAVADLKDPEAVGLAASMLALDAQHAAILNLMLGEYPVPDVFAKTEKAARM